MYLVLNNLSLHRVLNEFFKTSLERKFRSRGLEHFWEFIPHFCPHIPNGLQTISKTTVLIAKYTTTIGLSSKVFMKISV